MAECNLNLLTKVLTLAQIHQLRATGEGDVVILELTGRTLGKVDCQCVCNIQSSHICTAHSGGHTAAAVSNNDGVTASLNGIRKCFPQTLQSCVVFTHTATPSVRLHVLMYNVVGEESTSVDLDLALFQLGQELTAALFVMPQESRIVTQVSTGRDSLVLDLIPAVAGHLDLNHIQVLQKLGLGFAVGLFIHTDEVDDLPCILPGRGIGRLGGRQPLGEQRNAFALLHAQNVSLQLFCNSLQHILCQLGIQQTPKVIPATILRYETDQRCDVLRVGRCHVAEYGTEQTALTQATTNVTGIEQPLHCDNLVFEECLLEAVGNIHRAGTTQRSNCEVEIQQCLAGSAVGQCAVLSCCVVELFVHGTAQRIHKVCHCVFPP